MPKTLDHTPTYNLLRNRCQEVHHVKRIALDGYDPDGNDPCEITHVPAPHSPRGCVGGRRPPGRRPFGI
jgi:hypothetical protein